MKGRISRRFSQINADILFKFDLRTSVKICGPVLPSPCLYLFLFRRRHPEQQLVVHHSYDHPASQI